MGLLREDALSGYQIRQIFETSDMGNYSSSPGSIYPALKRLVRLSILELITHKDSEGKAKKRYRLTSTGKSFLLRWLQQEVIAEDVFKRMEELLLRFAFMDQLIAKEQQVQFLQQIAGFLPKKILELQQFHEDHIDAIPLNGLLAIQHGIAVFKAHYRWVQQTLKIIQNTTHLKS